MLNHMVEIIGFSFTFQAYILPHTHYTLKRESLVGTLEAPRGVRQMNGVPQSGADRSATAESRVRVYWSNLFTVIKNMRKILSNFVCFSEIPNFN